MSMWNLWHVYNTVYYDTYIQGMQQHLQPRASGKEQSEVLGIDLRAEKVLLPI